MSHRVTISRYHAYPQERCLAVLLFAAVCWLPVNGVAQTGNFNDLAAQLNSLENEYRQTTAVPKRIELLQQAVAVRDVLLEKIGSNDLPFRQGTNLENASAEETANLLSSLRQSTNERRYSLSELYQSTSEFSKSVKVLERMIADSEAWDGQNNLRVISYRNRLKVASWLTSADESSLAQWHSVQQMKAEAHQHFGNQEFDKAGKLFVTAIEGLEKLELAETIEYGEAVANYAEVLLAAKKLDEAEMWFEKAILVNDKLFQTKSPTNAQMRRSFSRVFTEKGDFEKAIEKLDEADALFVENGPEASFDRGVAIYLKGNNQQKLGNHREATRTYYDAVQMMIQLNDNRLFEGLQKSIHESYRAMNSVAEPPSAVAEKAVEIGMDVFDNDPLQAANWLLTMAKTEKRQGQQDNHVAIYERTEELLRSTDGFQAMPLYVTVVNDLTAIHRDSGNPQRAIPFAEKAIACAEATSGVQSAKYANYSISLASLFMVAGEYKKAEAVCAKIGDFLKSHQGEQNPAYPNFLTLRAECLQRDKQFDRAIEYWSELRAIQESNPNPEQRFVVNALSRLAAAYDQTDQPDLAKSVREELKAIEQPQE